MQQPPSNLSFASFSRLKCFFPSLFVLLCFWREGREGEKPNVSKIIWKWKKCAVVRVASDRKASWKGKLLQHFSDLPVPWGYLITKSFSWNCSVPTHVCTTVWGKSSRFGSGCVKFLTWHSWSLIHFLIKSQNHRMFRVGGDHCGPSSPTLLPKQGHLQ